MAETTNKHPGNVLENIITRSHFVNEDQISRASKKFLRAQTRIEKSSVSLTASYLTPLGRTVLTKDFLSRNKVTKLSYWDINE